MIAVDDPFRTLGLEPRFDLSASEIAAAHLRTVSRLHPDRATDPLERDRLLRAAASAGAAKQLLSPDSSRAEELLKLLGARISVEPVRLEPAFLVETLELREAIEEACAPGTPESGREGLAASVGSVRDGVVSSLRDAFAEAVRESSPVSRAASLSRASGLLVQLRYLDRMIDRLRGG